MIKSQLSGRSSSSFRLPADSLSELTLFSLLAEQRTGFNSIYNNCSSARTLQSCTDWMFLCRFALKPNSPESGFVLVWRINQKVGSVCFQDDVFSALKPKNLPESGCSKWTGRQASVQPHYSRHVAESGKLPAEMFDHILFIDAAVHILIRERVCLVSSLDSWTTVELLLFVRLLFQQNNVGTNQSCSVKRQFSQLGEDELDCPAQSRILQVQSCGRFSSPTTGSFWPGWCQPEWMLVKHFSSHFFMLQLRVTRLTNQRHTKFLSES